jgi:hypothetical protein
LRIALLVWNRKLVVARRAYARVGVLKFKHRNGGSDFALAFLVFKQHFLTEKQDMRNEREFAQQAALLFDGGGGSVRGST